MHVDHSRCCQHSTDDCRQIITLSVHILYSTTSVTSCVARVHLRQLKRVELTRTNLTLTRKLINSQKSHFVLSSRDCFGCFFTHLVKVYMIAFVYRVDEKSKLLILIEYVNETEKIGGM